MGICRRWCKKIPAGVAHSLPVFHPWCARNYNYQASLKKKKYQDTSPVFRRTTLSQVIHSRDKPKPRDICGNYVLFSKPNSWLTSKNFQGISWDIFLQRKTVMLDQFVWSQNFGERKTCPFDPISKDMFCNYDNSNHLQCFSETNWVQLPDQNHRPINTHVECKWKVRLQQQPFAKGFHGFRHALTVSFPGVNFITVTKQSWLSVEYGSCGWHHNQFERCNLDISSNLKTLYT